VSHVMSCDPCNVLLKMCNVQFNVTRYHVILVMSCDITLHHNSGGGLWSARDLFRFVVPLLCYDGEIREVAVTALGMVNPQAFG